MKANVKVSIYLTMHVWQMYNEVSNQWEQLCQPPAHFIHAGHVGPAHEEDMVGMFGHMIYVHFGEHMQSNMLTAEDQDEEESCEKPCNVDLDGILTPPTPRHF